MRTYASAFATATLFTFLAVGCGKTDSGGGAGSETHWLTECNQDGDCGIGSCLCGVCTVACNSLRDCPDPLDVCNTTTAVGVCDQAICGSTKAAKSQQGLLSVPPTAVERQRACDNGRQTEVTYVDVGYRPSEPGSAASRLIPEGPAGFLLFNINQSFYRVDGAGNLVRTLPPPQSTLDAAYDDAVPLGDGSLVLSGRVHDRAWVGKVDAAWNMVWEHELDLASVLPTVIVGAADGGAVVLAQQGTHGDDGRAAVEAISWARLSAEGEVLWQHQEATTTAGITALGGDNIRIAFAREDGIHVLDCDLEGNYDLAPLVRPGNFFPSRLLRLPNDHVGLAYFDGGFLVLDQANQVLWDHPTNALVADAVYDATRQQIFLVGQGDPMSAITGTWVERLTLDGDPTWSFSREEWPPGSREGLDRNAYGESLAQVAVDAEGNVAARSPWASTGLDILWLDIGACGGESVP